MKGVLKTEEKGEKMSIENQIVRYANSLDTSDICKMAAPAQDVLASLMAEWRKEKTTRIEIPLLELKKKIKMESQRTQYIDKQVNSIAAMITSHARVCGSTPEYSFVSIQLIPFIGIDPTRTKLIAECRPEFLEIFEQLEKGYTEYKLAQFVNCRSKYAKNLFRLFSKNFKGECTVPIDKMLEALGMPINTPGGRMLQAVRRGVADLLKNGIYETIDFKPIREDTRGVPISAVYFKYKLAEKTKAKLAGQEELPGLEDGAAAPSIQQAAPADPFFRPDGGGEKPTISKEEMENGLSAATILAAGAVEPPKPSGHAGGGSTPAIGPTCPNCGKEMIKRTVRNGERAGKIFWGCPDFPDCLGSRNYLGEN